MATTTQMQFKCVRCGSIDIKPENPGMSTLRCGECKQRQRIDLAKMRIVEVSLKKIRDRG